MAAMQGYDLVDAKTFSRSQGALRKEAFVLHGPRRRDYAHTRRWPL